MTWQHQPIGLDGNEPIERCPTADPGSTPQENTPFTALRRLMELRRAQRQRLATVGYIAASNGTTHDSAGGEPPR